MLPSRRRLMKHLAKIFDVIVLLSSFAVAGIAYSLPKGLTFTRLMTLRITIGNCLLFVLLLITWHSFFAMCGLYVSKRLTTRSSEAIEICKATFLASIVLVLSAWVFHIGIVTVPFVVVFCLSSTTAFIACPS